MPVDGRRLGRVLRRKHDLFESTVARGQGEAKRSADRAHLAVQAQLADEESSTVGPDRQAADHEERDGHGKVERGADLSEVGGSEVDRDGAASREESRCCEGRNGRARALPSRVASGSPDDREAGKTLGNVDLDVEDARVETGVGGE